MASSRADMHCHSTASAAREARRPEGTGAAGVRNASGGGLRAGQAARHGLRDDHRSRHDRRRAAARRPPRRVRLGGADGLRSRRAAGRARALLRHHARRPRVAPGAQRRRRGRAPSTCTRSEIACALAHPFFAVAAPLTPRHRRRLAAALPGLGDPQRLARAGAEHAGRDLHRDARRHRHRRLRRPRRRRHRPHLHRDPAGSHARRSSSRTCASGRAEARGDQGSAAKWAHAAMALAARVARLRRGGDPPTRAPCWRWPSGSWATATCAAAPRRPSLGPDGRPQPAARLARVGRPAAWRCDELIALLQADGVQPRRPLPPRAPGARAAAARRGRTARSTPPSRGGDYRRRRLGLFEACIRGDPLRAGGRLPRAREGQAGRPATTSRARVGLVADGSAACTA